MPDPQRGKAADLEPKDGGEEVAGDRGAETTPPATVNVIMRARRPWAIGESIGLSRGYTFAPGVPVEVAAADAAILCSREWDGRRFVRA